MRKLLLILILLPMLFSVVSAEQTLSSVKKDTCITLLQSCTTCTYNNISSIRYPNGTELITDLPMTKSGISYSYNFCANSVLGTMTVSGHGDKDGIDDVWIYDYQVTPTGIASDIIPFVLGILGLILLALAIFNSNSGIGIFSAFCFIILGVYVLINGFSLVSDDYSRMIGYITLGVGLLLGFASVYEGLFDGGNDED